jgi:hypothetical protein
VILSREVPGWPSTGARHVRVELVPRPGVPIATWRPFPELSRLRFTTRYETRFLAEYPETWARLAEAELEGLWLAAESA